MNRIKLSLLSAAVAAISCLTVLSVLREPPSADPTPAPHAVAAAPQHSINEAPAPPTAPDPAQRIADAARAAHAHEQAVRDAILGIAAADDLSLDARLARYREAVRAAQAEAPYAPLEQPGMLTEAFLRTEAVQEELAALSPAARSGEIAHIRRELGYGDEEIARMEVIDERREVRWQNGLAYMQERARLTSTFAGGVLEDELRELRSDFFAHEAPTIEAEERDGFFRFERPRIYGRN